MGKAKISRYPSARERSLKPKGSCKTRSYTSNHADSHYRYMTRDQRKHYLCVVDRETGKFCWKHPNEIAVKATQASHPLVDTVRTYCGPNMRLLKGCNRLDDAGPIWEKVRGSPRLLLSLLWLGRLKTTSIVHRKSPKLMRRCPPPLARRPFRYLDRAICGEHLPHLSKYRRSNEVQRHPKRERRKVTLGSTFQTQIITSTAESSRKGVFSIRLF